MDAQAARDAHNSAAADLNEEVRQAKDELEAAQLGIDALTEAAGTMARIDSKMTDANAAEAAATTVRNRIDAARGRVEGASSKRSDVERALERARLQGASTSAASSSVALGSMSFPATTADCQRIVDAANDAIQRHHKAIAAARSRESEASQRLLDATQECSKWESLRSRLEGVQAAQAKAARELAAATKEYNDADATLVPLRDAATRAVNAYKSAAAARESFQEAESAAVDKQGQRVATLDAVRHGAAVQYGVAASAVGGGFTSLACLSCCVMQWLAKLTDIKQRMLKTARDARLSEYTRAEPPRVSVQRCWAAAALHPPVPSPPLAAFLANVCRLALLPSASATARWRCQTQPATTPMPLQMLPTARPRPRRRRSECCARRCAWVQWRAHAVVQQQRSCHCCCPAANRSVRITTSCRLSRSRRFSLLPATSLLLQRQLGLCRRLFAACWKRAPRGMSSGSGSRS